MPTKTNVAMNWDYPELFTVDITTGNSRMTLLLTREQLKKFKTQIDNAIAEHNSLTKRIS